MIMKIQERVRIGVDTLIRTRTSKKSKPLLCTLPSNIDYRKLSRSAIISFPRRLHDTSCHCDYNNTNVDHIDGLTSK